MHDVFVACHFACVSNARSAHDGKRHSCQRPAGPHDAAERSDPIGPGPKRRHRSHPCASLPETVQRRLVRDGQTMSGRRPWVHIRHFESANRAQHSGRVTVRVQPSLLESARLASRGHEQESYSWKGWNTDSAGDVCPLVPSSQPCRGTDTVRRRRGSPQRTFSTIQRSNSARPGTLTSFPSLSTSR